MSCGDEKWINYGGGFTIRQLPKNKTVLDVCCGSRMFWFDKSHPNAVFCDIRDESHILSDGRTLEIKPDMEIDFTDIPFFDNSFKLVVFDPPHLVRAGRTSYMAKKYGVLGKSWRDDLRLGFSECLRVLAPEGVLIFKWNETQIQLAEILKLIDCKPLFGHKTGKHSKTHWVCFMKMI